MRRLSCVYPDICPAYMVTDHTPTSIFIAAPVRLKGIKILIASGVRYDIAVEDPRFTIRAGKPSWAAI